MDLALEKCCNGDDLYPGGSTPIPGQRSWQRPSDQTFQATKAWLTSELFDCRARPDKPAGPDPEPPVHGSCQGVVVISHRPAGSPLAVIGHAGSHATNH